MGSKTQKSEEITAAFVRVCVSTAQRLHETGMIQGTFARVLPIVIHELDYYDEIAQQTAEANPPGVADGFVAWINSL